MPNLMTMDRDTIKAFIRWCEHATDAELRARRRLIEEKMPQVSTREGRADLRLALRLLDEECLARLELKQHAAGAG